ncbi:SF-assemblin [Tribonema minus]|uniref:SF-assemblin n=1 Tax=Tribonema minus TaxID=303371 RepID=A0A835YWA4_9STRA|nr:SF-assemblin [Tribonema minus]
MMSSPESRTPVSVQRSGTRLVREQEQAAANGGGGDDGGNTKTRLSTILNSFSDFDQSMKIGVRQRRERDEHRVTQLTAELTRLEKMLNVEIKRRIELNKSIQTWAETEVDKMTTTFRGLVTERSDAIHTRLEGIVGRITALEAKFDAEMAKVPVDIERRTEELTALLTAFEAKFDAERASRLEREGRIIKQLSDHEAVVARDMEAERGAREAAHAELRRALEDHVRSRTRGDDKFQGAVAEELAALRNAVEAERVTRAREDDEIVDALNRYTTKLQTSLRIINSADT